MSLTLKDRCKQKIAANAGTNSVTLSTSVRGFKTISGALSNGDTSYFCLESANGDWEVFSGTYTASGTTISRDTVLASSNSGNKIDIGTSITFCYIVYPADKATYKDGSGRIVSGAAGIIFSDASVQTTAATTPDLSPYAPLASPTFTGVPAAPTAAGGTNTTQIATTAFVASAVGSIDLSPYLTISSAASTYLTQSSATTLLAAKADLVGGLIPSAQLPSYVDDVVEAANLAAFPGTGETGKIYVAVDTGYTYRWSGSVYVRINEVDLSSYLTSSAATATYLPLAGGTLTGDLKFTDATYDIGKSGATRPRDGFFSRNLTVGNTSTFGGKITAPATGQASTGGIGNGNNGIDFYNGVLFYLNVSGSATYPAWCTVSASVPRLKLASNCLLAWGDNVDASSAAGHDLGLARDAADTLHQRRDTNAQTFRVAETWTSSTSFGAFQIKANAGAAYQIGSAIGSAGGTNRNIEIGRWNAAGTFAQSVTVYPDGCASIGGNARIMASYAGSSSCHYDADVHYFRNGGTNIMLAELSTTAFSLNRNVVLTQPVAASGSPTAFTITEAAHTTLAASTEATAVNFNLSSTKQFATGALTTQRAFRIQAPTYSFVGASTITTASTLSISGPPVAGTNATITNAYALNIESGNVKVAGDVVAGGFSWWTGTYGAGIVGTGTSMSIRLNAGEYFTQTYGVTTTGAIALTNSLSTQPSNATMTCGDSVGILEIRGVGWPSVNSPTTAQSLRVYNTYTSATSGEWGEFNWSTTSNVLRIGTNKGSAGGSARNVAIVHGGTVVANFLADRFYLGPIADSTATGGNTRGQYAVDLQRERSAADQIASGLYSVITGGRLNKASGNVSAVVAGQLNSATGGGSGIVAGQVNTASGSWSFVGAGELNNATGQFSGICGGQYNTASGDWGFVGGGLNNTASASGALVAGGIGGVANRYGMTAHASGTFAANGDAQSVRFTLRNKTTNTTPTTLFLDGSSSRLTIPSGKTMSCKVMVKGIKSDGSAKARFVRLVEITNVGGTTALDTAVEALGTDYNPSGCVCTITEDNTNDALDISVTGVSGETWRWVCTVEGLEIAYGT